MNQLCECVVIRGPFQQHETPSLDSMIFSRVLAILLTSITHCQIHARADRRGYVITDTRSLAATRLANYDVLGLHTEDIHLPRYTGLAKSEVDPRHSYAKAEIDYEHIIRPWPYSSHAKISRRTNQKSILGKTGKFLADVARRIPIPRHGRVMKNDARVRKALSDRPLPKGYYG